MYDIELSGEEIDLATLSSNDLYVVKFFGEQIGRIRVLQQQEGSEISNVYLAIYDVNNCESFINMVDSIEAAFQRIRDANDRAVLACMGYEQEGSDEGLNAKFLQ